MKLARGLLVHRKVESTASKLTHCQGPQHEDFAVFRGGVIGFHQSRKVWQYEIGQNTPVTKHPSSINLILRFEGFRENDHKYLSHLCLDPLI
jgi:hypothetical protein